MSNLGLLDLRLVLTKAVLCLVVMVSMAAKLLPFVSLSLCCGAVTP